MPKDRLHLWGWVDFREKVNGRLIEYKSKDSKIIYEIIETNYDNYKQFEEEYSVKYFIEEKSRFISIKDRLTEDTKRRFNGEYFTPTIWVKFISNCI